MSPWASSSITSSVISVISVLPGLDVPPVRVIVMALVLVLGLVVRNVVISGWSSSSRWGSSVISGVSDVPDISDIPDVSLVTSSPVVNEGSRWGSGSLLAASETGSEAVSSSASSSSTSSSSSVVRSVISSRSESSSSLAVHLLDLVLLNLAVRNWRLVTDVRLVHVSALGQSDLQHCDDPGELEVVKSLVPGLILVNDSDVADLVDLVESTDSVLDQLGQVYCGLDRVGDALDDDGVLAAVSVEQLPGPLEVPADSDSSPDSDLVGREGLLLLLDSAVGFGHLH